jgi:hypothetical protein
MGNSVNAISTILLTVFTGVYVYLTYSGGRLVRDQLEESLRPLIVVDPVIDAVNRVFKLRIRNLGRSAATNLRMSLDRDMNMFGSPELNLRQAYAFREGIATFGASAELTFELGVDWQMLRPDSEGMPPARFSVNWSYNFAKKTYRESASVDFHVLTWSTSSPDALVRELQQTNKLLDKIADALKAIQAKS